MNFDAIEAFIARVKQISASGSKEMRLSFQEANALALNIGELMIENQKNQPISTNPPSVIDGGSFTNRIKST